MNHRHLPGGSRYRAAALLLAAVVVTGGVAACGGGQRPAGAAGNQAGTTGRAAGGSPLLAFSQCMRQHGIPDFPDLSRSFSTSQIQADGIDTGSATYQHALAACRAQLPGGSGSTTQLSSAAVLAFARCVRANGIPNFPDPTVSGGHMKFSMPPNVTLGSPQFRQAFQACSGKLNAAAGGGA